MISRARLGREALPLIAAVILSSGAVGVGFAQTAGDAPPAAPAAPSGAPAAAPAAPVAPSAAPAAPAAPQPPGPASPPAPASSAAAPTPAPPAPPANLEPLAARDYTGILGKKIRGPDGAHLGLVVDVLVDANGRPHAAVIDFGGFLGVGSRKIAIDWRLLKLKPGSPDWKISLDLNRTEIQGAPEYKPDDGADKMVGPPQAAPASDTGK